MDWSQLTPVLYDNGVWGDIADAPKIALNVDIRGFSEEDTPGKHAFFIDPATHIILTIKMTIHL